MHIFLGPNYATKGKTENLSAADLNIVLAQFYAEGKKTVQTMSLKKLVVMQAFINRRLKEKGHQLSTVWDPQFFLSNKIFKRKATKLKEEGKGNRPNTAKPLTWSDERKLWIAENLSKNDPETLICTLWFTLMQHNVCH